jgi:hypothetical protein
VTPLTEDPPLSDDEPIDEDEPDYLTRQEKMQKRKEIDKKHARRRWKEKERDRFGNCMNQALCSR